MADTDYAAPWKDALASTIFWCKLWLAS